MYAVAIVLALTVSTGLAVDVGFRMQGPDDVGWHEWSQAHEVHNPNGDSRGLFAVVGRRMVKNTTRLSVTVARPTVIDDDAHSTWLEQDAADSLIESLVVAYHAIWGTWPRAMRLIIEPPPGNDNGGA